MIFSRIEGLKSNSIELLLPSLAAEVANMSADAFFNLGIEVILNASKFVTKSHTSF